MEQEEKAVVEVHVMVRSWRTARSSQELVPCGGMWVPAPSVQGHTALPKTIACETRRGQCGLATGNSEYGLWEKNQ